MHCAIFSRSRLVVLFQRVGITQPQAATTVVLEIGLRSEPCSETIELILNFDTFPYKMSMRIEFRFISLVVLSSVVTVQKEF